MFAEIRREYPLSILADNRYLCDTNPSESPVFVYEICTWWRHQMEAVSALLAICAGNSPFPGQFPAHRSVTRGFDVFFDLRPDKQLRKQSWGWWFEMPPHSLWRYRNEISFPGRSVLPMQAAINLVSYCIKDIGSHYDFIKWTTNARIGWITMSWFNSSP